MSKDILSIGILKNHHLEKNKFFGVLLGAIGSALTLSPLFFSHNYVAFLGYLLIFGAVLQIFSAFKAMESKKLWMPILTTLLCLSAALYLLGFHPRELLTFIFVVISLIFLKNAAIMQWRLFLKNQYLPSWLVGCILFLLFLVVLVYALLPISAIGALTFILGINILIWAGSSFKALHIPLS